jgi:alkanesulfonate monooxygenase SsuD/methylene tetrahydromethanopterin reductase-like flavin-dependent oxidoreductase (luciferase family)
MEIGAAIFFTDYSMSPTDLAAALEERGFDSLWVAEHRISLWRGRRPRLTS